MRISGVVSKYKTSLLSGIIKLFCIDSHEIHTFFKAILAKWPYGSSKRVEMILGGNDFLGFGFARSIGRFVN